MIYFFINGSYTLFWKLFKERHRLHFSFRCVCLCFFSVALPLSSSFSSSPLGFSTTPMNKTSSLLDLGSSRSGTSTHRSYSVHNTICTQSDLCIYVYSSNSSPSTSLASNSPKGGPSDWAVPQASRLKYRQQFNSLDKQMIGYLTGTSS